MTPSEIITVVLFAPYFLLITTLTYGWQRIGRDKKRGCTGQPFPRVSLVIALRNEAGQVDALFKHLARQRYSRQMWQVIAVNDHSTDQTLSRLEAWRSQIEPEMLILNNSLHEVGKKAAVARGIEQARGELIVTTDADCRMGPYWLESVARFYSQHRPSLMFGPVVFDTQPHRPLEKLQALEFITLLAAAAGSTGIQRPVFCNAANMAFPKDIYQQLNDPFTRSIASGDDTMLLLKIKKWAPGQVAFNKSRQAMVHTQPSKTLRSFWNQRKRWVSKSRHYKDPDILAMGSIVAAFNIWLVLLATGTCFDPALTKPLVGGLLGKALTDGLLIFPAAHHLKKHHLWTCYPFAQILYPLYSSLSAVAGFWGGFSWKARRYHVN